MLPLNYNFDCKRNDSAETHIIKRTCDSLQERREDSFVLQRDRMLEANPLHRYPGRTQSQKLDLPNPDPQSAHARSRNNWLLAHFAVRNTNESPGNLGIK